MAAEGEVHQRKVPSPSPSRSAGGPKGHEEDKAEAGSLLNSLLSCFAGVGGVAILIWLAVFVLLEPYDPNKSKCTRVAGLEELHKETIQVTSLTADKWVEFGASLGMERDQLEMEMKGMDRDKTREAVMRSWYKSGKKLCWENVVQALFEAEQADTAKSLAQKYGMRLKQ